MLKFCCRLTLWWSLLIGVIILFCALSRQAVNSYEAIGDDYFDIIVHGDNQVNTGVDTDTDEFPGQVLDILKVKRKLDHYDRQILVFEHNSHRRTTEPLASDMVFMVWSVHLQEVAKSVAESCAETETVPEDEQTLLERWFSSVGINTWKENAMFKFMVGNVIHTWTEEKNYYSFDKNTCNLGKKCERYIQVIWATASHVGCELKFCPVFRAGDALQRHNLYYVVCLYGEGLTRYDADGNYMHPFKNGTFCDNCPTGFPKCIDGLCHTEPPCDTVIDCRAVVDKAHCLCEKSVYDHGHRLTVLYWTLMDIWITGVIVSSFIAP